MRNDLDDLPIAQAARVQPHVHHRAMLSEQGVRIAFWACDHGTSPYRHCPAEPDPFATLIRRIAERPVIASPSPEPEEEPRRCTHPASRKYLIVRRGRDVTVCRDCNRIQMQRWRERKRAAA